MKTTITHPFPPLFDSNSTVLILGSFPSVKSREQLFFYGHPQNRFWKVMARLLNSPVPASIPEKKALLLQNRIALWDSIASCEIEGSSDSCISSAEVNDLTPIFSGSEIRHVFCNGKKAWEMYHQYIEPRTGFPASCLPSTSPANAAWSLERLCRAWAAAILPCLQNSPANIKKTLESS
ncbi:MAG: DNA-deoxyinosine glycosylase [Oscillospiraceae bacterium]|nr:DNA-deoxyinosine glycosylase [Oscillospiraceae bacterium]